MRRPSASSSGGITQRPAACRKRPPSRRVRLRLEQIRVRPDDRIVEIHPAARARTAVTPVGAREGRQLRGGSTDAGGVTLRRRRRVLHRELQTVRLLAKRHALPPVPPVLLERRRPARGAVRRAGAVRGIRAGTTDAEEVRDPERVDERIGVPRAVPRAAVSLARQAGRLAQRRVRRRPPRGGVLASRPSRFDVASQSTTGTDPDPDRDEGSPPSFALGVWDGVSPLSLAVANPSSSGGAGRAAMSSPSDSDTPPAEGSADSSSRGSSPSRVPSPDAKANAVRRSSSSSSAAARASASARAAAAASHAAAAAASAPSESRGVQSPARSRDSSRDAFFRKRCAGDPCRESSSSSPKSASETVVLLPPPPEAEGWRNPSS